MLLIILCASLFILSLKYDNYFLVLLVIIGSIIVITYDNLFYIYLGIELQAFSTYILLSKNKIEGAEAGLKYFILGSISSGFFLLGLSIISSNGYSFLINELSNLKALVLILLALFFKLSLFPFYYWIPDIYEGSSWPIIALLIIPKISIVAVLLKLVYYFNSNYLVLCSLLSIIVGSIGAFNQSKIKRLLAYSGVTHIGLIVLPLFLYSYNISYVYLFIYLITLCSFIYVVNYTNPYIISISHINIIKRITISILLLSMAGVPPFSGFIVKFLVLFSSVSNNYLFSSLIIIILSIISVGFYLRLLNIIHFKSVDINKWKNVIIENNNSKYINDYYIGLFLFLVIGFKNFILW